MDKTDFEKFIERQREKKPKASTTVDPAALLSEWEKNLEELYATISEFMASYIDADTVRLEYEKIELNEEFSGPYRVRQMNLAIGNSIITFKPIGTILIGAKGRVDVSGPLGKGRLVLMNERVKFASELIKINLIVDGETDEAKTTSEQIDSINWVWKISTSNPKTQFFDLTQENFFDMILSIADG